MHAAAPDETWQVSHIGGDRFAANVLVLPDGLYYGRLAPADVEGFVAGHRDGRLDLEHLRGRCAYPFPAQAAEVFLRRRLDEPRADAVRLVSATDAGGEFEAGGRRWRVEVTRVSTRDLLTCRSGAPGEGWTYELADVVPAG
jgi:(2Fe-2S) ferredoxin